MKVSERRTEGENRTKSKLLGKQAVPNVAVSPSLSMPALNVRELNHPTEGHRVDEGIWETKSNEKMQPFAPARDVL